MLRHVFLEDADAGFNPEMLFWGEADDLRAFACLFDRFAASPVLMPLSRRGFREVVDGRAISLVPSAGRLGLRAATGAGSAFEWHLDPALALHFARLSLSLADAHPASGHHHLDGDADQEITVRLSLNEYPPDFCESA